MGLTDLSGFKALNTKIIVIISRLLSGKGIGFSVSAISQTNAWHRLLSYSSCSCPNIYVQSCHFITVVFIRNAVQSLKDNSLVYSLMDQCIYLPIPVAITWPSIHKCTIVAENINLYKCIPKFQGLEAQRATET